MNELLTALLLAALAFLADEALAWLPWLSRIILRSAARYVSKEDRDRMEEEWHAEMTVIPGKLGPLLWATSIWWGFARLALVANANVKASNTAIRIQDLALAGFFLISQAPLFLAIAIGVKLETRGPIVFRRRVIGSRGEIVHLYRFVTFDTETGRVTRLGRYLRMTNLYDLPVLINILEGKLSVVGPPAVPLCDCRKGLEATTQKPGVFWNLGKDCDVSAYGVRLFPTLRIYFRSIIRSIRSIPGR